MFVIGFGGSGHDFSTCVMHDGNILSFIEDERILRKKHCLFDGMGQALMKMPALKYCNEQIGVNEIIPDLIVANNSLEKYYYGRYKFKKDVKIINHHMSHAASAYFPSPFQKSAILIMDGAGFSDEFGMNDSISMWIGEGSRLQKIVSHGAKIISRKDFDNMIDVAENSVGSFYHIITHIVGFGPFDEGKTMGLAPYGTEKLYKRMRSLVDYGEEGKFIFTLDSIYELLDWGKNIDKTDFDKKADFAWAAQKITEDALIHSARYLKTQVNTNNICLAGGVILNSVANYKLYKDGLFKNYFIQPAAGDNGTSLGSAYYGSYCIGNLTRNVEK